MMALSEDDKDRLFRHWKTIKNNVEMRYIVDLLIEERVISPDEWEDMKKSHQLEKDRTEAFLHWLLKQSEKSYDAFLKALHNGKYDFISEKLDRNMQRNHPPADQSTQLGEWNIFNSEKVKHMEVIEEIVPSTSLDQVKDDESLLSARNFKLLWEKVNSDGENTRRKLESLNKEIEECKSALRKKEKEIKKLQEKYQQKEEEYSNLRQTLQRQNTEIINKEEEMKNAESQLKKAEQEVERLRRENAQKDKDYIKLSQTLDTKKREIIDAKEQMEDAESKFQKAEQDVKRLERENTQKEEDYRILNQTAQRQNKELINVKEQKGDVESKLNQAEQEIERLLRENTQLSRQCTSVNEFTESGMNGHNFRRSNTFASESTMTLSPDSRKRIKDEIEKRNKTSQVCCLQ